MPTFSARSRAYLETCDPRLIETFETVVVHFDCAILEGHRSEERQNELYRTGRSQLRFPCSKHNSNPSLAVDAAAYRIDWKDRERATLFAGYVMGVAQMKGVVLRWGGDWDRDWQVKDNNFDDLWHFEIVET